MARRFVAALAATAMLAVGCGDAETQTATIEDSVAELDATSTVDEPIAASEEDVAAEPAADIAEPAAVLNDDGGTTTDEDDTAEPAGEPTDESEAEPTEEPDAAEDAPDAVAEETVVVEPKSQVLAFALTASKDQSFSFTQGMAMNMNMMGFEMNVAPEGAIATGTVDDGVNYTVVDIGSYMVALFGSLDAMGTGSDPELDAMVAALDGATMSTWATEDRVVLDMTDFIDAIQAMDPTATDDLGPLADGPVSFDPAATGIDAAAVMGQLTEGGQTQDPTAMLDLLQAIDTAQMTGTTTVAGRTVDVWTATASLDEYYDALGIDVSSQLGALGMGDDAMFDDLGLAFDQMTVELVVMVDGDDLVRRIETVIDMGAMMSSMVEADDAAGLFGDIEMVTSTWQEFDEYGADFDIVIPDAVDVTNEIDSLLDQ